MTPPKFVHLPHQHLHQPARKRTATLDVEAALLDAAMRILETHGAHDLSVRRIAAEAGVAPMGVYKRFGNKNGIVDALFSEGFTRLTTALRQGPETVEVEDDLVAIARLYRRFALANASLYQLMFLQPVGDFVPSIEAATVASSSFEEIMNRVERAVERGSIEAGDPVEIAQRLWSLCHGVVALELLGIGFVENHEAHMDLAARSMARGLIAGRPGAPIRGKK